MTTKNYPFASSSEITPSEEYVQVIGGQLTMAPHTDDTLTYVEDCADDTGWSHDATKAEFAAGKIQQLSQISADETFYAGFTTDEDAQRSDGSATGTLTNATVADGKLDCTGTSTIKYVDYDADANADSQQAGTIRFKFTPDYSGAPAAQSALCVITKANGQLNNLIRINHASTGGGSIKIAVYDSAAALQLNATLPAWTAVSGTEVEFELNYTLDAAVGANSSVILFIDGSIHGTEQTNFTCTRDANIALLRFGADRNAGSHADGYYDDIQVFSTAQHGDDYTPADQVEYKYLESYATMPMYNHNTSYVSTMLNGVSFATTDANSPRYALRAGSGDDLYWNGSAWVVSDLSWSQASTEAQINTNIGTFPISGETTMMGYVIFQDSVATQQNLDIMTLTYNGYSLYDTEDPYADVTDVFDATELTSMTATTTIAGSDMVKYTVDADGQQRYVTGGSAANSAGTYAQASTLAEMNSDMENLITARKECTFRIFLHSDDGSTCPSVDLLSIVYNEALPDPTTPTLVELEGFIYDKDGVEASQLVEVRPYASGWVTGGIFVKYQWQDLATTDADGYFMGTLWYQGTANYWEMRVDKKRYKFQLPDQAEVDLADLTVFEAIE